VSPATGETAFDGLTADTVGAVVDAPALASTLLKNFCVAAAKYLSQIRTTKTSDYIGCGNKKDPTAQNVLQSWWF